MALLTAPPTKALTNVRVGRIGTGDPDRRVGGRRARLERVRALDGCVLLCHTSRMRTSVVIDDELAAEARELGINVSEAAREGLRHAVRQRRAELDRQAYLDHPEPTDDAWDEAEAWGEP